MQDTVSRKGLAQRFLTNMRDQAHKAGYDMEHDMRGFMFQLNHGLLTHEELKTSVQELEQLQEKNRKARGLPQLPPA
jgi:hypothetical protein